MKNLPFKPKKVYRIKDNAWEDDISILFLVDLISATEKTIVLVAGGPYSCTLIYNLWRLTQDHILMDIGSTLDPLLYGVKTRQYHERLDNS